MVTDTEVIERFWKCVEKTDGCWLWTGTITAAGALQFNLSYHPRRRRSPRAISWELANGQAVPDGHVALPQCKSDRCVHPEHLKVGTQVDFDRWTMENRAERFWARVDRSGDGCWEWKGARASKGLPYGIAHLGRPRPAHVVAWVLTHGEPPPGMFVCHSCDNPPCCRPSDLFLGTAADNSADMASKGRASRHPKVAQRKLTDDQVRAIRARYAAGGVSMYQLAREFAVAPMRIHGVVHRLTYSEVAP